MNYVFDIELFNKNFQVFNKDNQKVQLKHNTNNMFKLFPYKTSGKKISPLLEYPEEFICEFIKRILNVECKLPKIDKIFDEIAIDIEEENQESFRKLLTNIFFDNGSFKAHNIALYHYHSFDEQTDVPYAETITSNEITVIKELSEFLVDNLGIDKEISEKLEQSINDYEPNVLESLMIDVLKNYLESKESIDNRYYKIQNETATKFKEDLKFMLENDMTDYTDLSNLLSLYYFNYVTQTCFLLNRFCNVKRTDSIKLYYALDWEKISVNRECCTQGWKLIKPLIENMFCHAVTLEILNQNVDSNVKYDYIKLGEIAKSDENKDKQLAEEIKKASKNYIQNIYDIDFSSVEKTECSTLTETEIEYLYNNVRHQFLNTVRHRAKEKYAEKFEVFCKGRWLKNRRKAGLVLNLTEQDIIFLTKISIKNNSKIRLNLLFGEFEKRGVSLDNTSKELLTEYFSKLNLIDKKSDSGDAQYVKRIL